MCVSFCLNLQFQARPRAQSFCSSPLKQLHINTLSPLPTHPIHDSSQSPGIAPIPPPSPTPHPRIPPKLQGEGENFKLHDVIEVVGVVSVVPGLAAMQMRAEQRRQRREQRQPRRDAASGMEVDGEGDHGHAEQPLEGAEGAHHHDHDHDHDMEEDEEDLDVWGDAAELGAHPPTSQALRLHAVTVRRVPPREPLPRAQSSLKPEELRTSVGALRAAALRVLCAALGGDELAAEYVLACALGCVHKRVDGTPHGHVHLNLTCATDGGG